MESRIERKENSSEIALLGALCFFFSALEYIIPKPVPFFRLGLANLPLLIGLELLSLRQFCLLVMIKIIGQALLSGTLFSYIFVLSAAGTFSAGFAMLFLHRLINKKVLSYIGISVIGALISNSIQLWLAVQFLGKSAWLIAPFFLGIGLLSSFFLGFFANYFSKYSVWLQNSKTQMPKEISTKNDFSQSRSSLIFFVIGIPFLFGLCFSPSLFVTSILFFIIVGINLLSRKKIVLLPFFIMTISIVFFNVLSPTGRVLWYIGSFPITEFALFYGIKKALTIEGMVFLSRWMIRPPLFLPGKMGKLISEAFVVLEKLTLVQKKKNPAKKTFLQNIKSFSMRSFIQEVDSVLENVSGSKNSL